MICSGLTQYPRCPRVLAADGEGPGLDARLDWKQNSCIHSTERSDFGFMGYSMMTDHTDGHSYRFVMWSKWNGSSLSPIWDEFKAIELYNHSAMLPEGVTMASPFDSYESRNLANDGLPFWQPRTEESEVVAALTKKLKRAFGFPG
eukprot:SAG22_NODE_464_length_10191_cov_14.495541_5_plen_146_part_00